MAAELVGVGLVLGASGGIGGACLQALAPLTRTVVAVSRKPLDDVPAEGDVRSCRADLATDEGRAAIVEAVTACAAPIAWVVIASGQPYRGPVGSISAHELRALLDVNLVGPMVLVGDLLKLDWRTPAAIVVIGSLSARRSLPDRSAYGATKAGLEQFARSSAVELAPRGIAVNTVSVGVTDTPFLGGDEQRLARYVADRVPLGRMGTSEEVADVVRYLVQAPMFLTGATIELDGGTGVLG